MAAGRSSTFLISITLLLMMMLLNIHDVVIDASSSDMSVLTGPPQRPEDFNNPCISTTLSAVV